MNNSVKTTQLLVGFTKAMKQSEKENILHDRMRSHVSVDTLMQNTAT